MAYGLGTGELGAGTRKGMQVNVLTDVGMGSGNFPEWDAQHPLHLVGHSSGVQVARMLQTMLAEKVGAGGADGAGGWGSVKWVQGVGGRGEGNPCSVME